MQGSTGAAVLNEKTWLGTLYGRGAAGVRVDTALWKGEERSKDQGSNAHCKSCTPVDAAVLNAAVSTGTVMT